MSAEARLFRTESGGYWLHDPSIGLLAWIVPEEEAQKALKGRRVEMAPTGVIYHLANPTPPTAWPSRTSGGPLSCC